MANFLKHAWSIFNRSEKEKYDYGSYGRGYFNRPDRPRLTRGNERSLVTAVLNRISMDAAAININHVRLDDNNRYLETIDSGLNNCLTLEANIDQTGRALIQDIVLSMLDEGCVAVVPTFADDPPSMNGTFKIRSLRTAKILEWKPEHIRIRIYNDKTGEKEEFFVAKKDVAIIENPFYAVINEPNSTMQRLMRKLSLLDVVDEQSSSGKLNMIIQLPYVIKSKARMAQAEVRRKQIENQLTESKFGIAYADGTERIIQLNRPLENNLMSQIEYLTNLLYSQLGITQAVLDGTANEQVLLNYHTRTIEPILSAITGEMKRKFLSRTARTQHQSIEFFRDPFRLVPVSSISEIADKFTRNEIMSSNEVRQIIGMKPSDNPEADELRNKNLSAPNGMGSQEMVEEGNPEPKSGEEIVQNLIQMM